MFDIGFWELVLIAIIGLIVLGPERLPVAIRTVRGWINGARQFSNSVKTELKEELRIHELHQDLKIAEQQDMKDLSEDVSSSVRSLKEAAAMVTRPYEKTAEQATDKANIEQTTNETENKAISPTTSQEKSTE